MEMTQMNLLVKRLNKGAYSTLSSSKCAFHFFRSACSFTEL